MTVIQFHAGSNEVTAPRIQHVSQFEADEIAVTAGKRLAIAARVKPTLAGLRADLNRLDDDIRHVAEQLSRLRERIDAGDLRPWRAPFPQFLYWSLMVLAVAGELALAKLTFDLLGVTEQEAMAIAVTLGLIMIMAAKTSARVFRQKLWQHRQWAELTMAFVTNVASLFLFWQTASLRASMGGDPSLGLANFGVQLLIYLVMVFGSMFQQNPDVEAEQTFAEQAALNRKLREKLWLQRKRIAEKYNSMLARARVRIRAAEEVVASRIYEFRDGICQTHPGPLPLWFQQPISANLFEPLLPEQPVDKEPAEILRLLAGAGAR